MKVVIVTEYDKDDELSPDCYSNPGRIQVCTYHLYL